MIICDWCKEEISSDHNTKFYSGLFHTEQGRNIGVPKVNIRLDMHQTCATRMANELKLEIQSIIMRKEKNERS